MMCVVQWHIDSLSECLGAPLLKASSLGAMGIAHTRWTHDLQSIVV